MLGGGIEWPGVLDSCKTFSVNDREGIVVFEETRGGKRETLVSFDILEKYR